MEEQILYYYYISSQARFVENPVLPKDPESVKITRQRYSQDRDKKCTAEFTKSFGYPVGHPLSCGDLPKIKYSRLNILLPRKFWVLFMGLYRRVFPGVFQKSLEGIKPKVGFSKSSVGPHITLFDPFVPVARGGTLDEVHDKMKEALKDFPKFHLKVDKFEYFTHKDCFCLYLQPEPISIVQDLMTRLLKVFPQCHDQISRFHNTQWNATMFTPHVSVAKLQKDTKKMEHFTAKFHELKKELLNMDVLEFQVSDIQVLIREGFSNDEVFEVGQSIELGSALTPSNFTNDLKLKPYRPKWGLGSLTEKMKLQARGRSLLIGHLPLTQQPDKIDIRDYHSELGSVDFFQELNKAGFRPVSAIVLRKYEKTRRVGVAEFVSHEECLKALAILKSKQRKLFGQLDYIAHPLWATAYPDIISDWTVQKDFSPVAIANELLKFNETPSVVQNNNSALFELDLIVQFATSQI